VDQRLIDKVVDEAHSFFRLPLEEKMALHTTKSPNFTGYTQLHGLNAGPEKKGDLFEQFQMGYEPVGDQRIPKEKAVDGGSQFPSEKLLPSFKPTLLEYHNAMLQLSFRLLRIFALALELPEDYFDAFTKAPGVKFAVNRYPPQKERDPKVLGIGTHTDHECFTILRQDDDVNALQVLNARGQWIAARPIPGTYVVNIGDTLMHWTNDLFLSTVHRAINVGSGKDRISVPFFFGVDYDTIIQTLPSFIGKDGSTKYEPITAGDYVASKLYAAYPKKSE